MVQDREPFLRTCAGRIYCRRCQAKCKATQMQCGRAAVKGKQVCYVHGGRSKGPTSVEGRERCSQAKTIHGRETRAIRLKRQEKLIHLAELEALGRANGIITGSKTRGPKPGGRQTTKPR